MTLTQFMRENTDLMGYVHYLFSFETPCTCPHCPYEWHLDVSGEAKIYGLYNPSKHALRVHNKLDLDNKKKVHLRSGNCSLALGSNSPSQKGSALYWWHICNMLALCLYLRTCLTSSCQIRWIGK